MLRIDRGPASMKAPMIVVGCLALLILACVFIGSLLDTSSTDAPRTNTARTEDQLAAIDVAKREILESSIVLARPVITNVRRMGVSGRLYAVQFNATYRDITGGVQNGAMVCTVDLETGKARIEEPH